MMTKKQQEQLYNRNGFSKSSSLQLSSALFRSFYGHNKWLWTTALLFGLLIVNASAIDEKLDKNSLKSSQASTPASSLSSRDEIYIDDEGLEGSGRGGPHDDLEKDHDFSGSGFGPDDEDSDIYSHHSHTHNTDLGKANRKQKIDFNSNSNNNNNNNNNNDDDFTISRNNNQQNLGASFGGSSGNSNSNNNQGLNTDNNQNNQNSNAKNPSPEHHPDNTGADNDDFDLDENFPDNEDDRLLPAGSGNGPITDDDTEDSDDDGDDGDILTAHKYPDLGGSSTPKEDRKPIYDDFIEEGGDNDLDKTHKADDDEEDADAEGDNDEGDNNEDDNQDNDDEDADDDDDGDDDDSEVGTEFYTDITEHGVGSSSSSSSSSSTTSTSSSSGSSSTTEKRPGGINTQGGTHDLDTNSINSLPPETKIIEQTTGNEVSIMNANDDDRTASFFAQPGILAAVIGGAVVGLLCAILVVMFIVYRMRKKDEGSYALDEPKRSPAMNSYAKNGTNREFYA